MSWVRVSIHAFFRGHKHSAWGFPGGLAVKIYLPEQEMWLRSLCQEDHLEKEMATYSSILACNRQEWTEESGGL